MNGQENTSCVGQKMGGSRGEGRKERRMVFLLFGLVENELSERNERDHINYKE